MFAQEIRSLEHPTLKVPYEILNKKFRVAQRNIEREVSHMTSWVEDIEKAVLGPGPTATVGAISDLLSGVVDKLTVLKRKAKESILDELEAARCCKRRLDHLRCAPYGNDSEWKKLRLNRMLVEHLLRCGYYETAIKLAIHCNILHLTNVDLFLVSRQVEQSLLRKETGPCLTWCYDNKSKLKKIKCSLELNIRQQEFIELVRKGRRLDAIKHARKYFAPLEWECFSSLEHVMGVLAFSPDTKCEPYASLFASSRWSELVVQFREANSRLYQLDPFSVFTVALQSGLSALKTPQCYRKDFDSNPDCPVCQPSFNKLAAPLPYSHCSQSRLICYISGDPINEDNLPLVLPNGNVYGEVSLKEMAEQYGGKVICPRTKQVFSLSQAEKVYVM